MGKNHRPVNTKTQAISFALDVYLVLEKVRHATAPATPRSTYVNETLREKFLGMGLMPGGPAAGKSAFAAAMTAAKKMPAMKDGQVPGWLARDPDIANWLFRFLLERGTITYDPATRRWQGDGR